MCINLNCFGKNNMNLLTQVTYVVENKYKVQYDFRKDNFIAVDFNGQILPGLVSL